MISHALYIKWSEMNLVGVPILDEQHRGVVSVINSFYYHKNNAVIERFLTPAGDALLALCRIHFMTEEELLELSGYPDVEAHKKMHKAILIQIETTRDKCRAEQDADGFMSYLRGYWLDHVNNLDKLYVQQVCNYLEEKAYVPK